MSSTVMLDCLVIGGGISGLGLAHWCARRGLRTQVLEKSPQVGGCLASHAFQGAEDFWVEMGAHTCYNSYGHLLDIGNDLGLRGSLVPKAKLRFQMLVGNRLQSIVSRLFLWQLVRSLPRLFTAKKTNQYVAGYYSKVLGIHNYQRVFGPAFDAVICQPADLFPADLLFRRKRRRKGFPRSFTLPQGLGTIPAAMAAQPGLEVVTGQGAARVAKTGDGYQVTQDDGQVLRCRHLAVAVAPDQAASLLADCHPELTETLARIRMAKIESVGVMVAKEATSLPPLAGIIASRHIFYSAVSRDYLAHPSYRGFTFHFRPDRSEEWEQRGWIQQALKVPESALIGVERRLNRLPALRVGHHALVQDLDAKLAGLPLALLGNYFLGVSIEDCLTRSASEFRRLWG